MSSHEVSYSGTVDLKPGTTWQQIQALYRLHVPEDAEDDPQLLLDVEPTPAPDTWVEMLECTDYGHVQFQFGGDQLSYSVGGEHSWDFVENFDTFLAKLAEQYAARGWTGYEGEEDLETHYGATELDKARARLASARLDLKLAQENLVVAEGIVKEMEGA